MADLTLGQALGAATQDESGIRYPFAENWAQGRTAYGGYSSALLLDAALRGHDALPPLRSALINFTGPISEDPLISAEVLRQGRNVSTVNARATTAGKVVAQGTFSFGKAQSSHVTYETPAPEAKAPEDTEHFFPPSMKRSPARFFENFDSRLIAGNRPFAGADHGYSRLWVRHKDESVRNNVTGLMCLADALPPAVFTMCTSLGPNSSMTWICNFLTDTYDTEDGWWMMESTLSEARDGYSSQVMRIWNSEGQLVVEGMQSVIIFI